MIEEALDRAEEALRRGESLNGTGFWKAVAKLRRDPEAASVFADRVARIDRQAFERSVKLRVPAWAGTVLLAGGTAAGLAAAAMSSTILFMLAFGLIDVCTHSLVHVAVGRLFGIRFTHYFLGGPPPPRPGAKVDYESYLRTPPKRRAFMHASGAVVTKIVPFAMLPVGLATSVSAWALWIVLAVGVGQIISDVAFSTKTSDWKKVLRELRAAAEPASFPSHPSAGEGSADGESGTE